MPTNHNFPVLDNIAVDTKETNKNGCAALAVTDLETPTVFKPQKLDGDFPDYEKVIPKQEPKQLVGLGVPQLEKAIKTLKALGADQLKMSVYDELDPIKLEGTTEAGDTITAVIMPRRLG